MFDQLFLLMKRLKTTKHHSGAGENISLWKLIRHGLPYYLDRRGYALPPLTVFFVINGSCNLRCRMCDIGQQNKDSMFYQNLKGDLSQDFPIGRFKTLIDEFQSFRPYIGVTTTEPLLYPNIFQAVEYANFRGLRMNISTNGLLLEKYVREIMDSGLHRLSVSLDGPAHIHNKMRGVPGTYERVIKGLEMIKAEKKRRKMNIPHLYISSFICDANYAHMVEFIEGLALDGIEKVNIKLMVFFTKEMVQRHNQLFKDKYTATAACVPYDFSPDNLDIDLLYEQTKEIQQRFGDVCRLHFEPDKEKFRKYFFRAEEFMDSTRCVLPWFVAQITAKGDLLPLTRCYSTTYGNIMDKPFLEAWNGPQIRALRCDLQKHGRFSACARCDGLLYR